MRRPRRSPQEAWIERELDWWAVCLVGTTERVPRFFGDNYGGWPMRFMLTAKPRASAGPDDRASPYYKIVLHEFVYVEGRERGRALIRQLDSLLLGDNSKAKLRHGWREVDDPQVVWGVLLGEALRAIKAYDEDAKQAKIRERYERQVRALRVRRRK
jgi:hypothetical protein